MTFNAKEAERLAADMLKDAADARSVPYGKGSVGALIRLTDNARAASEQLRAAVAEVARLRNRMLETENEYGSKVNGYAALQSRLAEVVGLAEEACDIARGMTGHNHWDPTMRHGAGCPLCIQHREATDRIAEIRASLRNKEG